MKTKLTLLALLWATVLSAQTFTVGTFNLCTSGSRKSFVEKGKAGVVAGPQRYWCNSATAVADAIADMECDILGVQEVCDSIWGVKGDQDIKVLVAQRKDIYEWILYPNTEKGISYDVAIAYKRELFDTLATGIFWTGGHPDRPKTKSGEPKHVCKPLVWALFRDKQSGKQFYFLDTHTVVPQKYKNDEWPKNRGNILNLQETRRCGEALVAEDVPSILVGDLNVSHKAADWKHISEGRWEDVYSRFYADGTLDYDDREWGTQNTKDEEGWTKWHPDHIMLHGFKATDFRVVRDRYPTVDGTMHYPSDHFPLVAKVRFDEKPLERKWEKAVSPDGRISIEVSAGDNCAFYRVLADGKTLVSPSRISMTLSDGAIFGAGRPKKIEKGEGSLVLKYTDCTLEACAFDDGVAWRWIGGKRKAYKVVSEQAAFRFDAAAKTTLSYTHKNVDPYQDDFQNLYTDLQFPVWSTGKPLLDVAPGPFDKPVDMRALKKAPLAVVPALVVNEGVRMVIAESDVRSYPGMFLKPFGCGFSADFAGYPSALKQGGKRNLQWIVTARENYIASCSGKARSFPWRVICIAREDKELAGNDLITRLAPPSEGDFSWVKPGKVAWEWWSQFAIGEVDFTPGVNTQTYKAYIDFAARNGIEYVLMDEGWAVRYADDLFAVVPEIDLQEIIAYGNKKNVGIILWAGYSAFVKDIEKVCKHYAAMGVKGFKIDFFERNDQIVQDVMLETARIAAKHKLLIDFHGCPPPTGLQKQFPNVLNYEGIFGLEQLRNRALPQYDMVSFDVTAPYIRFVTGPADYTPGAFLNGTRETFVPYKPAPMSQGTRCHQLAAYVVFDGPMQMLCDGPARYEADQQCAEFIYRVPTVWDETRVLDGKIGAYIVTARRKGNSWYIGALTDWSARDLTLDLAALGISSATIEAWEDGPDASVTATDWKKRNFTASGNISIHLAPGGGWAGIVKSVK